LPLAPWSLIRQQTIKSNDIFSPPNLSSATNWVDVTNSAVALRGYFPRILRDPYSAHFQYGEPVKAVWQAGALAGGGKSYGYLVTVLVNAKNGFGGYTGNERYDFFLMNGHAWNVTGNSMVKTLPR
jgi:hypothetical protein